MFEASDGNVYLMAGGGDEDFVIRQPSDLERACLRSLTGLLTVEELQACLAKEFPASPSSPELCESLEVLCNRGLVEDAADDDDPSLSGAERERFDRQLAYLGDMIAPGASRSLAHARLRRSRIAVVGLGGFGSWTALALGAAGVGAIDLIDGDVVEPSNLSRQVLYGESDIGHPKAEAAARRLRALDSSIAARAVDRFIDSVETADRLLRHADFVIELADEPVHELSRWINRVCHLRGIPHISASMFPPKLRIGPLFAPGVTGCFECQEAGFRDGFPLYGELCEYRRRRGSIGAPFAPGCAVIGGLLAGEVTHYLTGIEAVSTLGTAIVVDLRTLEVTREAIPASDGCDTCASLPSREGRVSGMPHLTAACTTTTPQRSSSSRTTTRRGPSSPTT
jgi:bacteriocin biosynthesis cyclodehydratase domain-containing protein